MFIHPHQRKRTQFYRWKNLIDSLGSCSGLLPNNSTLMQSPVSSIPPPYRDPQSVDTNVNAVGPVGCRRQKGWASPMPLNYNVLMYRTGSHLGGWHKQRKRRQIKHKARDPWLPHQLLILLYFIAICTEA